MAFPKPYLFTLEDQRLGQIGRYIGHPARVFILRLLNESSVLTFREIADQLPLHKGTVTEHLSKLLKAGLVKVSVKGLYNLYSIDREGIARMYADQQEFAEGLLERRDRKIEDCGT